MRHSISFEPYGAAVTAYNVADPDFSPPGTGSLVLTVIAYAEPWLKLSPSEYMEAKTKMADKLITLSERIAPGLREHIEVMEIATPLTNIRYTGNPGGSIIGFDENFQGVGNAHLPNRGPLEGLYFANAWVNIGGGFETCIESGWMAARDAMKDMEQGKTDVGVMEKMERQLSKEAEGAKEIKDDFFTQTVKVMTKLHPDRITLKVKEIIEETASTKTLRMVSADGPLPYFRAGQYVNLFMNIDNVLTSRPYSISSAPDKPYYDITVRRMDGGFVSHYLLDRVKPGATLESTSPNGSFCYESIIDPSDLVFLAGGSGVTPFMSIIRDIINKKAPVNIHLLYGSRSPEDIVFHDELNKITAQYKNIKVDYIISVTHLRDGQGYVACSMLR
jgi:ferredoxin-NADP reductase